MSDDQHVYPVNDIIEHELTHDCICGPRVEWVSAEGGEE